MTSVYTQETIPTIKIENTSATCFPVSHPFVMSTSCHPFYPRQPFLCFLSLYTGVFLGFYINGITQHILFVWHLLLGIIILRLIHVVAYIGNSFLFTAELYIHCMDIPQFIYTSPVPGHFQFGASTNKAGMNIHVEILIKTHMLSFLLNKYL